MQHADTIKITGRLTFTRTNAQGVITLDRAFPNLVVTSGKIFVASRIVGVASAVMSHMSLGAGGVAPIPGDTALGSELGRVALSSSTNTLTTVEYTATFPAGTATGSITEAGIFNASSAGTMLCRTTFPVITKGAGDTIAVSWKVTLS